MRFSTKDRDQDTARGSYNCARTYTGAFWYKPCQLININGQNLKGNNDLYGKGMIWKTWKCDYYSLKTNQMKFRPDYIKN